MCEVSPRRSTLTAVIVSLMAIACVPLFGRDTDSFDEDDRGSRLTTASLVSAAFPLTGSALQFVPVLAPQTASTIPWISNPLLIGSPIPLYWIDPSRALGYTAAGLGLSGAGVALMFAPDSLPVAAPLSSTLLNGYAHLMEYSVYDTYALAADLDTRYRLRDLVAAPLTWSNIREPIVWIPSVIGPAALVGFYLVVEPGLGTPVYTSGRSFIGNAQVGVALGGVSAASFAFVDMLSTAIGEEVYYRGVVYEETTRALGRWRARVLDMFLFPALHLPSDLQAGFKTETILFNFCWRSAMTLVLDSAYDRGGLPLSVATHFWGDFVLIMARWLFYGG